LSLDFINSSSADGLARFLTEMSVEAPAINIKNIRL
jgi:hypothetical protein